MFAVDSESFVNKNDNVFFIFLELNLLIDIEIYQAYL